MHKHIQVIGNRVPPNSFVLSLLTDVILHKLVLFKFSVKTMTPVEKLGKALTFIEKSVCLLCSSHTS